MEDVLVDPRHRYVKMLLYNHKIECHNKSKGCDWEGKYEIWMNDHKNECPKVLYMVHTNSQQNLSEWF